MKRSKEDGLRPDQETHEVDVVDGVDEVSEVEDSEV